MNSEAGLPVAKTVTVGELIDRAANDDLLRLAAGRNGLSRQLTHPRVQKSGLVLVGHTRGVVPTRVQVFGETEMSFLASLDADTRAERIAEVFRLNLSLVVVTRGVDPFPEMVHQSEETSTALAVAPMRSSEAIQSLHALLDMLLAPSQTLHGVLIDVHGIGTLLVGPSGIGKSECALFLIERGHRFVADDQVILTLQPSGIIVGRAPPLLRHHLEVRGIGIINVRELFGATSVRDEKVVHMVVELCPWVKDEPYDRLGLDDHTFPLLGEQIPMLRIPVRSGRNMAVILEVAARNQLLKRAGHHAARRFVETLSGALGLPDVFDTGDH